MKLWINLPSDQDLYSVGVFFHLNKHDQNIYLDTKINLLLCQRAELHLKVALNHVVEIVLLVGVHWEVLKPIPINSAWSKTYIWTPKIKLPRCQGAELHLEVALDCVVAFVLGVGVHWGVLKPVPINSAWLKTYIWPPRSNFYNARELSYTLKWPWTMLLALFLVLV